MTPEVSRRVAKIMHTKVITDMSAEDRITFTDITGKAKTFESLPKSIQEHILSAEEELKNPST